MKNLILVVFCCLFLFGCSGETKVITPQCPKNDFKQGDIFEEKTTKVRGIVSHTYECTDKVAVIVFLERNPDGKTLSKSFKKNYLVFSTSEITRIVE